MALTDNGLRLLDIAVKGGFGTLVAAGVAYSGHAFEVARENQQDEERTWQSSIELTNRQGEFDADLGMRLFSTLMGYYFQKDKSVAGQGAIRQQMLLLRLVSLNFEDAPVHLSPLYDDLDNQLSTKEDKQALRGIAREVARRQAFRMTVNDGYDSGPRNVRSGDSLVIPELLMAVKIDAVDTGGASATIYSQVNGLRGIGPLMVTYFDEPLVDNIVLGENRVALLLLDSSADTAVVRVIAFPKHLAADRFDTKEMSRAFRNKRVR